MHTTEAALNACLRWIDTNRQHFALQPDAPAEERLAQFKPLGELVLTATILARHCVARDRVGETAAWAWRQLRDGEELLELLVTRPDLMVLTSLYGNFRELGLGHTRVEEAIFHLAESPGCMGVERPAWRDLDIRHALDHLGVMAFPQRPESGTWLGGLPEPWCVSDDIAYAITHEVFYITDFGTRPDRLADDVSRYIGLWGPAWLEIFTRQANWDITAELVMVLHCCGHGDACSETLTRLCDNQEPDGLIPSPPHGGRQFLKGGESPDRRRFLANYHTTLVATMALAMAHARG